MVLNVIMRLGLYAYMLSKTKIGSVTIFTERTGMQMQDFIVVGVLVAEGLAFSNQVPIQFLLVVKGGVGKARDCSVKELHESSGSQSNVPGKIEQINLLI